MLMVRAGGLGAQSKTINRFVRIVAGFALLAASSATAGDVRWRAADMAPAPRMTPAESTQTVRGLLAGVDVRHLVFHFRAPISPVQRAELGVAGVALQTYLGENTFLAAVSAARFDEAKLARFGALTAAEILRPALKLHPLIARGDIPDYAVVGETTSRVTGLREDLVAAYILLHRDVALNNGVVLVRQLGGTVRDRLESVNGLVIELPYSQFVSLADRDEVQWIELALPKFSEVNNSNRSRTGADIIQNAPYSLDGSGVTVLVFDGGTARASHTDFGGRLTVRDNSGQATHATHVAGTIGGSGAASGGTFKGMAPGVTIESYGLQSAGGIFLYTNPGDIESDYDEAINTFGADVANNSIGTNTETNGFPCEIQGDYGVTAALIDSIVGGALGEPFRIIWANGNERQGSRCDVEGFGDYYSTAPPACAKNHITVGALNSNNDGMTGFSSWGPCDDGRIKPDISAPGCQSGGDGGVTSCSASGNNSYTTMCGTSMASPTVCGLSALLIEDYRNQFGELPDPRNSTLKALFAHTAVDRGNVGPDYQFGYGSVRIQPAVDTLRAGRSIENSVNHGETFSVVAAVGQGASELKITLAWDDAPGTPLVIPSLVNDLDLQVYSPSGVQSFPWTLDPLNPSASAVRNQSDHINNIEQVLVNSPEPGMWRIEVSGTLIPAGPQVFSLVVGDIDSPAMAMNFPDGGPPELLNLDEPAVFAVEVIAIGQSYVADSAMLHYRYDGGNFSTAPLALVDGNLFEATLPAPADCDEVPEFYISAEGSVGGLATRPADAPATVFTARVGTPLFLIDDDFEQDQGWTVQNFDLTDGAWERGVPVGGGDRGDPAGDFDLSGQCMLTANRDGNSDVDGGPTVLISPTIDLSDAIDPILTYARWFSVDNGDDDRLDVEISNDNGNSWTLVESAGNWPGWFQQAVHVIDFVELSSQVKVRFSVSDNPNDSIVEAAVDGFSISDVACGAEAVIVLATGLEVVRGRIISGSILEMFGSDDTYLVAHPGFTADAAEPPVWLVLTGTSIAEFPAALRFRLESSLEIAGVTQRIELFDFASQAYEEVDVRVAPQEDTVVEIVVDGDASRFVDSETLEVNARLTWTPGPLVKTYPWEVRIDQAIWRITP